MCLSEMNFFAVLLLFSFISEKSTNGSQDETFHKNTKIRVKSSTANAQDGTFHENAKTNVNSSTATEDGTFHENAKRNGNAGLNVVLRNDAKQGSQLTRFRRLVSSLSDTEVCYRHYFLGETPPIGFKTGGSSRYICQGYCPTYSGCFSTLYDLTYKIPIYSAYFLRPIQLKRIGSLNRNYNWRKETGPKDGLDPNIKAINKNIDSMYSNTGKLPCIHKGHLVPAETYSFAYFHIHSTFAYTNAVPQYQTFNSGQWSAYEEKIRKYGKNTCAKNGGTLYLLTGISDRRIGKNKEGIYDDGIPVGTPKRMPEDPKIVIPNSMWTAGCCVNGKGVLGSFAVIGNNDPIKDNICMSEVTVKYLEEIIGKDVIGGINLFPGNVGCRTYPNKDMLT